MALYLEKRFLWASSLWSANGILLVVATWKSVGAHVDSEESVQKSVRSFNPQLGMHNEVEVKVKALAHSGLPSWSQ
jgi:hypothetical protein